MRLKRADNTKTKLWRFAIGLSDLLYFMTQGFNL